MKMMNQKVITGLFVGLCPAIFASVTESFVTTGNGNETLCTYATETPQPMASSPGGSGLKWGAYSHASVNTWEANVGIQGAFDRLILYSAANAHATKSANHHGTYAYTLFNMSGGTVPEVTVNLGQLRANLGYATAGQQFRWLLRDGAGQWFLSDDVTTVSASGWYSSSPGALGWRRVNAAAEADMNQLDADAKTPMDEPGSLSFQTPDLTQVSGGGIYIEQGPAGSAAYNFILNNIEWVSAAEPASLYVATNGSDANPGTLAAPFATLEGARNAIRSRGLAANGVDVYLRGGTYRRNTTFSLTGQDSGGAGFPVVYQAYPGEEVILSGAEELNPSAFAPVTDPAVLAVLPPSAAGMVLECDLAALGITDYGQLGQASGNPVAPAELFFNERPMTLAQWPNEGFTLSGNVIQTGSLNPYAGATFEYADEHIESWSTFSNVWVGGHWHVEMFDSMQISAVDTAANTITTVEPPLTWGSALIKNNRRMFYFNVLDELDLPTEYYIDRTAGKLYFYPPDFLDGSKIQLSMLGSAMVDLNQADYIQFKNLIFEAARHRAIGTSNASNLEVHGCTFRNLGKNSITCWLGENILVDSCDFYETGDGGVCSFGGDRQTLVPGNHQVENCHFYNYSRLRRTGSSPARLERVGHKVRHNLAHGNWRGEFSFPGNDHLFEYNEINNILKNSNDTAAIGSGFDWTASGTHIRYNFIHNYHGVPSHSIKAVGVYVDDGLSGNLVYQNVFYDLDQAFFSHGGRGTVVDNNLMIDCPRSFYFMDASLVSWWGSRFTKLINKLNNVPWDQPLYMNKYPHLTTLQADLAANTADPANLEYQYPKDNVGTKNLIYNSGAPEIPANAQTYGTFSNNYEMAAGTDAGFVDTNSLNFGLLPNSPVFSLIPGFQDIPFDQIGLYTNAYRPALPTLGTFRLFLPADSTAMAQAGPVEFVWESCPFADEYLLEIATDPDFNNVVVSTNKEDMCLSYAAVSINGLSPTTPYYWRVRAWTNARSMELAATGQNGLGFYMLNAQRPPHFYIGKAAPSGAELVFENLSPYTDYQVDQSTNLMSAWQSLTNFTAPVAGRFVVGPVSNLPPAAFYRLQK